MLLWSTVLLGSSMAYSGQQGSQYFPHSLYFNTTKQTGLQYLWLSKVSKKIYNTLETQASFPHDRATKETMVLAV